MGLWWLAWLLLIVAGALVLGYLAYRLVPQRRMAGANRAREILDERYARGEIDEREYRHRRDELA